MHPTPRAGGDRGTLLRAEEASGGCRGRWELRKGAQLSGPACQSAQQPAEKSLAPPNKCPVGDSQGWILCSSRQCQFAWNGFLLTFLMGFTVPVSCHRGFGFLAFALWAFNAPLFGNLTSISPLPSPALLRAPVHETDHFPGRSSALFRGCGGRAANHSTGGAGTSRWPRGEWGEARRPRWKPSTQQKPCLLIRKAASIWGRGTKGPPGPAP